MYAARAQHTRTLHLFQEYTLLPGPSLKRIRAGKGKSQKQAGGQHLQAAVHVAETGL